MEPLALNLAPDTIPFRQVQTGGEVIFSNLDREPVPPKFSWISNVLPTEDGISTTREVALFLAATVPGTVTFDPATKFKLQLIWRDDGSSTYYLYTDGKHLTFQAAPEAKWEIISTSASAESYAYTAYLQGKSYCFQEDKGVYTFGADFQSINVETINGLSLASIEGITSSNNYLIMWSFDTIYWSSPTNPLEFDPGTPTPTGAGSSKVQAVRSQIKQCLPTSEGFIIYTSVNAVSARYSNNSTNPWVFREIANSGGIIDSEHVSHDANAAMHFAWTSSGLQRVTHDGAEVVFPGLSDFLAGTKFDRLGADGNTIEEISTSTIVVKVVVISSRYVCFSYGELYKPKEAILVYDFSFKRWGKLTTDHYDLVSYVDPELTGGTMCSELIEPCTAYHSTKCSFWGTTARKAEVEPSTIGVLKPDGSLNLIQMVLTDEASAIDAVNSEGEIRFGSLKLTRTSYCLLNLVRLVGEQDPDTEVDVFTKSTYGDTPVPYIQNPKDAEYYLGTNSGDSHTLRIRGSFNLANILVTLSQTGER